MHRLHHCHIQPCQAEELFGKKTCWDSVHKLEALVKKATSDRGSPDKDKLRFLLQAVHYYCAKKLVAPSELSLTALQGKSKGSRGLLDLLLFKKDILADWLQRHMETTCRLSQTDKNRILENMSNFAAFLEADVQWLAPMSPSAKIFVDLLEAPALDRLCADSVCRF